MFLTWVLQGVPVKPPCSHGHLPQMKSKLIMSERVSERESKRERERRGEKKGEGEKRERKSKERKVKVN